MAYHKSQGNGFGSNFAEIVLEIPTLFSVRNFKKRREKENYEFYMNIDDFLPVYASVTSAYNPSHFTPFTAF